MILVENYDRKTKNKIMPINYVQEKLVLGKFRYLNLTKKAKMTHLCMYGIVNIQTYNDKYIWISIHIFRVSIHLSSASASA